MRKLALDIGTKQIGVAITDPTSTMASPLTTIKRSNLEKEINEINFLVREYEIEEIIAGLPIDLKGEKGIAAQKIESYLKELEDKIDVAIKPFDERLTTKIAEDTLKMAGVKRQKRKTVIDELAATIILQNYIESEKKD